MNTKIFNTCPSGLLANGLEGAIFTCDFDRCIIIDPIYLCLAMIPAPFDGIKGALFNCKLPPDIHNKSDQS